MTVDFISNMERGFTNLHTKGAFLTVKSGEKANPMTISWGSIGFMWQKPVFIVMVRRSRYTYELIEKADNFTVSIPYLNEKDNPKMQEALIVCGTKSGRDMDKCQAAKVNLVSSKIVDSPVVEGCNLFYECKIVYKQPMIKEMLSEEIQKTMYADDDYHTYYYGEIVACYEK